MVVFDLETNGLLHDATRIHCVALHWSENDTTEAYNDEKYTSKPKELPMAAGHYIHTALQWLEVADVLVGHNIIGFDIPIIKKLYNYFNPRGTIVDTLILSRLYHPNLYDIDDTYKLRKEQKWNMIPKNLYGRHSLEAYGHRLGVYKGEFSKTTDWKEWSPEMQEYCVQDVVVTKKLCDHFRPYLIGSN